LVCAKEVTLRVSLTLQDNTIDFNGLFSLSRIDESSANDARGCVGFQGQLIRISRQGRE
jgi:hypothetical protein